MFFTILHSRLGAQIQHREKLRKKSKFKFMPRRKKNKKIKLCHVELCKGKDNLKLEQLKYMNFRDWGSILSNYFGMNFIIIFLRKLFQSIRLYIKGYEQTPQA